MTLPPAQIYQLARGAGFSPVVAVTMTAIALRESSGDPSAFNGDAATGDRSYGLWQINLRDPNVRAAVIKAVPGVAKDEHALLDPRANAAAAFALFGGNVKNLSVAWYIDRGGLYQQRYESHLPAAQAAALACGAS